MLQNLLCAAGSSPSSGPFPYGFFLQLFPTQTSLEHFHATPTSFQPQIWGLMSPACSDTAQNSQEERTHLAEPHLRLSSAPPTTTMLLSARIFSRKSSMASTLHCREFCPMTKSTGVFISRRGSSTSCGSNGGLGRSCNPGMRLREFPGVSPNGIY